MTNFLGVISLEQYHFYKIAYDGKIKYIKTIKPLICKAHAEHFFLVKLTDFAEITLKEFLEKNKIKG